MIKHFDTRDLAQIGRFPFCVIGSGAAGITIATALARAGQRVLLVDAGDWDEKPELDDAYRGWASPPHPATDEYRRQRFGGTTHLWGGRCVPLDELDMGGRPQVPLSGWPISYAELARFYRPAMDICDAGQADFDVTALGSDAGPMFADLARLSPEVSESIERYSLPTDFARKYREEIAASDRLTLLLRTRCTALNAVDNGARIESVTVSNENGEGRIHADQFILCGGGLETTRLLLLARQRYPEWRRFESTLGRYYMCHYDAILGELRFSDESPRFDFQKTVDGVYARRKFQFCADFQRRHQLLNSTFRLHFPAYANPVHGSGVLSFIFLAKSLLASEHQDILNHGQQPLASDRQLMRHVKNVVTDVPAVLRFAYLWALKIKLARRKLPYTLVPARNNSYPLEYNSEQVPSAQNRIELASQLDRFGVPRINVHWQLTDADIESGVESFQRLESMLEDANNCRLVFDRGMLRENIAAALPIGGHHMGTTRMGESVETSVVDANCKVHGVSNLYVASSSVFPTSGHANPTLTIVALALRLADHLSSGAGGETR